MFNHSVELGCGLIGIGGRKWGVKETPICTEEEALQFLQIAFLHSIRYFDTAPSYGESERRLGIWLAILNESDRERIRVATKVGEHWFAKQQSTYTDHSFESMIASIDQSLKRLGKIDVLQLHKTNPAVLLSKETQKVWEYAKAKGIQTIGASVSDLESARLAIQSDWYDLVQLPYNQQNIQFAEVITMANDAGKTVVINRPFNMGQSMYQEGKTNSQMQKEAFAFILQHLAQGIVLTGTKSPAHLLENIASFQAVKMK